MKIKTVSLFTILLCSHFSNAAVDLLTGGYVYRLNLDLPSPPGQAQVGLLIQYQSQSLWPSNLGFGWCADWTTQLEIQNEERYRLRDCRGDVLLVAQSSPKGFQSRFLSPLGDELKINAQGIWIFRKDGTRLRFNADGLLLERYKEGLPELFRYDGLKRLRVWQRTPNQNIVFSYSGVQRVARYIMLQGAPRVLLLQKDGNLVGVQREGEDQYRFEYDDLDNLTIIRFQGQLEESIEYDSTQDVVKSVHQIAQQESWHFSYRQNEIGQPFVQRVIRQNTLGQVFYQFQKPGLLSDLIKKPHASPKTVQLQFRYDFDQNLSSILMSDGQQIQFEYNDHGQLTEVKNRTFLKSIALQSPLEMALQDLKPIEQDFVL